MLRSLFRGRGEVYAWPWENDYGRDGYVPANCPAFRGATLKMLRFLVALNRDVEIVRPLRGQGDTVAGRVTCDVL